MAPPSGCNGWELVLAHPTNAQLDWDLENEAASLTPWVLCHEGVQLVERCFGGWCLSKRLHKNYRTQSFSAEHLIVTR